MGFGLGLLAIPVLIFFDLRFVPGPLLVAALTLHMLVLRRDRSGVDASGLTMLLSGRVLGTIPAALILASLPLDGMKLLLAGVVLAGAIMGALHSSPRPTRPALFTAGTASGFMATVAGLGGPPVALIYQHSPGAAAPWNARGVFHHRHDHLSGGARVGGTIRAGGDRAFRFPDSRNRRGISLVAPGGCLSGRRVHADRRARGLGARRRHSDCHSDVLKAQFDARGLPGVARGGNWDDT